MIILIAILHFIRSDRLQIRINIMAVIIWKCVVMVMMMVAWIVTAIKISTKIVAYRSKRYEIYNGQYCIKKRNVFFKKKLIYLLFTLAFSLFLLTTLRSEVAAEAETDRCCFPEAVALFLIRLLCCKRDDV